MEIISIDLGSNSFRVLKFDCIKKTPLAEFEKVVGTADGLAVSGIISNEALKRIIKAVNEAKAKVGFDESYTIKAVTTAAMRKAANAKEILQKIKEATGIEFRVIDGNEESRLTLLAMKHALKRENIKNDDFILVDIGGGSTELIFYSDEKTLSKSFDLGIVTLTQSQNYIDLLKYYKCSIGEFLNNSKFKIQNKQMRSDEIRCFLENSKLISTAGTPTTVAAIKCGLDYESYDSSIVNGTVISYDELDMYKKRLLDISLEQRDILVGEGRSEFIPAGIEIFKMIYEVLGKKESIVFDDGLREGVALKYCETLS